MTCPNCREGHPKVGDIFISGTYTYYAIGGKGRKQVVLYQMEYDKMRTPWFHTTWTPVVTEPMHIVGPGCTA
jgi:hypothetical protein